MGDYAYFSSAATQISRKTTKFLNFSDRNIAKMKNPSIGRAARNPNTCTKFLRKSHTGKCRYKEAGCMGVHAETSSSSSRTNYITCAQGEKKIRLKPLTGTHPAHALAGTGGDQYDDIGINRRQRFL